MGVDTRKILLVIVLLNIMNLNISECRRTGGGGGRRSSSRVTTSRPTRRTTSYSRQQPTTYRSAQQVTTPRYNIQTQQAYPQQTYNQPNYNQPGRYNQPGYNQPGYNQPGYNQPGYNQPGYNQPHYNQPGYNQPHYNQPGYNQPHYNQPGYNQPHYNQPFPGGNNYYSPGGVWQQNKDHSVRNSVLAGLGGSALGLYLGYKLGGLSNNINNPMGGGPGGGYPQYSVVHHYHHGDQPIPQNGKVEQDAIKKCDDVGFCTANTTPLCMTNGTVYCIASLDSTITCNENSTELKCVNSTITIPCDNSTNCNGTGLNTTSISIPCVTTINVLGDFGSNKLSVHKISKRAPENETPTTTPAGDVTTTPGSSEINASSTTTQPVTNATTQSAPVTNSPSSVLTNEGFSNKYCVTVIAEPIKQPEIPKNLSNEEYAKFVSTNEIMQQNANEKTSQIFGSIAQYVLF